MMDIPLASLLSQLANAPPQPQPQPQPFRTLPPAGPGVPDLPSPFTPDGRPVPPTSSYPPLVGQPARPYTPTPESIDTLMDALYGGAQPPAPLPPGLPQNVQDQIRNQPSYAEGQKMPSGRQDNEPQQPPNPAIDSLRQQFRGTTLRNAPTQVGPDQAKANSLRGLYRLPGFSGFTGGNDV